MSYKKWIYKYQFLQEESVDLQIKKEENIKKFNDYFISGEESEDKKPSLIENLPPPKNPNHPGKNLYKALSKVIHPDKGGDTDEFSLVSVMYRKGDTIGLYLKCEEHGIDVEKYIDEKLIKSFEDSCGKVEEELGGIKNTLSWVWAEEKNELRKKIIEKNFEKKYNLIPKPPKNQENK